MELRRLEMKKVFATLNALMEVMEALSKDADPQGVGRLIMDEVLVLYVVTLLIVVLDCSFSASTAIC